MKVKVERLLRVILLSLLSYYFAVQRYSYEDVVVRLFYICFTLNKKEQVENNVVLMFLLIMSIYAIKAWYS